MATWSTDTVKSSERFSLWHDVVCRTVLNVSTQARPEHFQARISGWGVGNLRFATFESTNHEIIRGREHLARAPADHYLISLQRRGQSRITQEQDRFLLDPGEIAILDGQRPFRIAFPEPVGRSIALVPKQTLDVRAPWLRKLPQRRIAGASPFVDLARRHLLQLTDSEQALDECATNLLAENLCNLLALASVRDEPAAAWRSDMQVAALLAFCRQRIGDPELSPKVVAARFGISLRTVHLRFETLGRSFGRWLLDSRLELCGKALRDPRQAACTISEIAYRCGFNDLSHFNKSFRARFRMTPREWRNRPDP